MFTTARTCASVFTTARTCAIVLFCALVGMLACACRNDRRHQALPPAPRMARVVSLSPSTTETIFAIGAGSRLVGRTRYCDFPPEALRVATVGGYVDASIEAIVGLAPNLVVGARGPAGRGVADQVAALGIETYFPSTESLAEIESMIVGLGDKLGEGKSARDLVGNIRARIERTQRAVSAYPRRRVLLVFGRNPIVVAGPDGFPSEIIRLAGGKNVIETGGTYPTVNFERLLVLDPEVVVDASMREADAAPLGTDDPGWAELAAVRERRVVSLREDALLRPGPRIAEGVDALARTLHPDARLP